MLCSNRIALRMVILNRILNDSSVIRMRIATEFLIICRVLEQSDCSTDDDVKLDSQ